MDWNAEPHWEFIERLTPKPPPPPDPEVEAELQAIEQRTERRLRLLHAEELGIGRRMPFYQWWR